MSEQRGSKDDKKGGSGNSTQTSGGWVPFKPLPSPQKRRWSETSNQSEIPKQFCSTQPFQDGGNSSIERHHETMTKVGHISWYQYVQRTGNFSASDGADKYFLAMAAYMEKSPVCTYSFSA